jgi:CheY-like chemotaxis protein
MEPSSVEQVVRAGFMFRQLRYGVENRREMRTSTAIGNRSRQFLIAPTTAPYPAMSQLVACRSSDLLGGRPSHQGGKARTVLSIPIGKQNALSRGMTSIDCSQQVGILAIDDEQGFLGMLKELLEYQGYMVHTASSPQEAIRLYEERWQEISMVILDYFLPGMSGDLIFEYLQQLNPDVRVVLLTGCHESAAKKMFQRGLWGYLQKPFDIRELGQKVRDAIDARTVPSSESPSPA